MTLFQRFFSGMPAPTRNGRGSAVALSRTGSLRLACAAVLGAMSLMPVAHAADGAPGMPGAPIDPATLAIPGTATVPVPSPWPLHHLIEAGTLTVGITAKSPPKSYTTPAGEYDGTRIALFKKLAADLGLKIKFVRLDWPGLLPGLAANRFDLAGENVSWNADRLTSADYLLTRPVAVAGTVLLVRADSGITSWATMKGRKLGGVKGEVEFDTAEKAIGATDGIGLPGRPEGLMAVLNKQIDGFAADASTAQRLIDTSPRKAELRMVEPAINMQPASVCVNKNEGDLAQAVNVLLTNYRVNGTLAAIEKQYTGTDKPVTLMSTIGY
ncbi:transporter substrate-binding domain-containing protein [Robbsia sp. KACC 23696]|uniref:substrate-binding periplasmic protein n=1 Tax=Robbsia sp. KACC 23696 TaxID=3149231 RepID=UPI00325BB1D8